MYVRVIRCDGPGCTHSQEVEPVVLWHGKDGAPRESDIVKVDPPAGWERFRDGDFCSVGCIANYAARVPV